MKVLNLYAGIGGNRKLWGEDLEITAVENNIMIAHIYQHFFPKDTVVVSDAHEYLLEHYKEYDFIWSSPPCPSHSSFRYNIDVRLRGTKPLYPDMRLYQEIIFLQYHAKGEWIVENVKPYYKPLIEGRLIQRHMFWSNFDIPDIDVPKDNIRSSVVDDYQELYGMDISKFTIKNKRQILRNCVNPILGLHILEAQLHQWFKRLESE